MTLVPSSANPKKTLRNLIILTHGISISNAGQALLHGAAQIWRWSTIVPMGLSVCHLSGLSDLM